MGNVKGDGMRCLYYVSYTTPQVAMFTKYKAKQLNNYQ